MRQQALKAGAVVLLKVVWATVVVAGFGTLALVLGRSVVHDLRKGHDQHDGVSLLAGLQGLVPVLLAGGVAIVCPVVILLRA